MCGLGPCEFCLCVGWVRVGWVCVSSVRVSSGGAGWVRSAVVGRVACCRLAVQPALPGPARDEEAAAESAGLGSEVATGTAEHKTHK